ncbi:hypothetical protein ACFZBE_15495 [Streptomyces sp. NPDC008061]|uniref:hypothetical protein n=1 Tax=Streptomyces sp. NPDC008061 TaxID=3364805 RepID=UPI0036EE8EFA
MFFTVTTMGREESAYRHPGPWARGHSSSIAVRSMSMSYGVESLSRSWPVVVDAGGDVRLVDRVQLVRDDHGPVVLADRLDDPEVLDARPGVLVRFGVAIPVLGVG